MPKKDKEKLKKWTKKRLAGCEHRSDKRTADFVAKRIEAIQEDLSDLLAEFRAFGHADEMWYATWCVTLLDPLRKKYVAFAENGVWEG